MKTPRTAKEIMNGRTDMRLLSVDERIELYMVLGYSERDARGLIGFAKRKVRGCTDPLPPSDYPLDNQTPREKGEQ